jgi:hypothetical protein
MAHKKTGTPRKKAEQKKQSGKHKRTSSTTPPVITDRRAMEKTMFDLGRLLQQQKFESIEEANIFLEQFIGTKEIPVPVEDLTPVERAQEKMYEAWDATGKRRVKLAQEALEISPDCADAYVLLAEETARNPEEALKLYEQGMQAGERALGPGAFQEAVGHFWGMHETHTCAGAHVWPNVCGRPASMMKPSFITGRCCVSIGILEVPQSFADQTERWANMQLCDDSIQGIAG